MTSWTTHSVLAELALKDLRGIIESSEVVCFDLETMSAAHNTYDWLPTSRVVSASFTVDTMPDVGWVVPLSHPEGPWGAHWRDVLRDLVESMQGRRLLGHNLKYDLRWPQTIVGGDLYRTAWWDTLVAASILDENLPSKRLKVLAADLMGGDWSTHVDLNDSESVPWFELAEYNAADTVATWRLHLEQKRELSQPENRDLAKVFAVVVMPALRAVTAMESTGFAIDPEVVDHASRDAAAEADKSSALLLHKAHHDYGLDADETYETASGLVRPVWPKVSWEGTSKWFKEFTSRAVDAGDLKVLEFTEAGNTSFAASVLERQAEESPLARTILEYRHGSKQSTFLRSWLELKDHGNRLHPTFNLARGGMDDHEASGGTVTGRTSSKVPNLQQVSKDLKHCFTARPGHLLCQIDYSQMELRIIAETVERCPIWDGANPMMQAFLQGRDLHVIMAAIAAGVDESEVSPELRQRGKAGNFGLAFGMGPEGFVAYARDSYGVYLELEEATEIHAAFYRTWEGVDHWHAYAIAEARKHGYVTNLFGRRRRLEDIDHNRPYERSKAERQAINAPIQAAASDIMLMALADLAELPIHLVCTVHDSVIFEVPEEDHREACEQAARVMLAPSRLKNFAPLTVPLAVDVEVGLHWGKPSHTLTLTDSQGEVASWHQTATAN